jgi:hypothetical protein
MASLTAPLGRISISNRRGRLSSAARSTSTDAQCSIEPFFYFVISEIQRSALLDFCPLRSSAEHRLSAMYFASVP